MTPETSHEMIGHDEPARIWRAALGSARLHHAWLLTGRRGLGKMHFARAAAAMLVTGDQAGGGQGQAAADQLAQTHPDIITLTHLPKNEAEEKKREAGKPYETRRNITIDQIRAMQRRLNTRPTLGDKRAILIDPADDMEPKAANALLKSLEEPPVGTYFFLIAHQPARLLPTIRSRCRVLRFAPLGPENMGAWLTEAAPSASAATREAAIAAAGGSPGAALEFVEQDLGAMNMLMQEIARKGDADFALRGKLTALIGPRPSKDRLQAVFELARGVLAAQMRGAERAQIPALTTAHAKLVTLGAQMPTYNFDTGLAIMEIGALLASARPTREAAHV